MTARARTTALCGVVATLVAVTGCGRDCAGVGASRLVPADTTIAVGASFTARYQDGGSCSAGGPITYQDVATTWHTTDTAVVAVDSTSGVVTGRAVGNAVVTNRYGDGMGVHVR